MKIKFVLTTALALCAALAFTADAQAAKKKKAAAATAVAVAPAAFNLWGRSVTFKGCAKKINEQCTTVAAEDGITYSVSVPPGVVRSGTYVTVTARTYDLPSIQCAAAPGWPAIKGVIIVSASTSPRACTQ